MSKTGAPAGKAGHALAVNGDFVLWDISIVHRFDPESNSWSRAECPSYQRPPELSTRMQRIITLSRKVVRINDGNFHWYDPSQNTCTALPQQGTRYSLRSRGWGKRPHLIGGRLRVQDRYVGSDTHLFHLPLSYPNKGPLIHFDTGAYLDASKGTWVAIPAVGAPHALNPVWSFSQRKLVVWGGIASTEDGPELERRGAILDLDRGQWTGISSAGAPTCSAVPKHLWTGKTLFIACKNLPEPYRPRTDYHYYNTATETWKPVRLVHVMSFYASASGSKVVILAYPLGDSLVFDQTANSFSKLHLPAGGGLGDSPLSYAVIPGGVMLASRDTKDIFHLDIDSGRWIQVDSRGWYKTNEDRFAYVLWTGSILVRWLREEIVYTKRGGHTDFRYEYDPGGELWRIQQLKQRPSQR